MKMLHPARKLAALSVLLVAASAVFIAPAQARHRTKIKVAPLGWCAGGFHDQTLDCAPPGGTLSRCQSRGPFQVMRPRYEIKRGKLVLYKHVFTGPGIHLVTKSHAAPPHEPAYAQYVNPSFKAGEYKFKMVLHKKTLAKETLQIVYTAC
ncbi:MAG: hypothetical protein JOZ73_02735 [Solirubrobacterales bacterium]|nr:hypothetical protein [Solirubrobacterales bacterium]